LALLTGGVEQRFVVHAISGAGVQARLPAYALHLTRQPRHRRALQRQRIQRELQAAGTSVQYQDGLHARNAARRRCAINCAMAHDAARVSAVSARLVNTIGTRAPSTTPAISALARYSSCLASMLPDSMSGTTRMSALPATVDTIPLVLAATSEIA